jgi:hypothetical protein
MMQRIMCAVLLVLLTACSNPKNTKVPATLDGMTALQPQLEKLTPEERELFAGYAMRHTLGAALGGAFGLKSEPVPADMTIGKAIEDQRSFLAHEKQKEAEEAALKAKLQAERDKAVAVMQQAAVVTLVSKKIATETGYSGIVTDEKLLVTIGFKNTSGKDIAGIKGILNFNDIFGDEITGIAFSYDQTLKAGDTATWAGERSVKYGLHSDKDRKFAALPDDKFKAIWNPEAIVFTDGTKLDAPTN